jgi:hypothetical protein
MKLLDNWRLTHRKYSAQAMAASITIQTAWVNLPDKITAPLPAVTSKVVGYAVVALLVLGIIGTMVDQGAVTEPKPAEDPKP